MQLLRTVHMAKELLQYCIPILGVQEMNMYYRSALTQFIAAVVTTVRVLELAVNHQVGRRLLNVFTSKLALYNVTMYREMYHWRGKIRRRTKYQRRKSGGLCRWTMGKCL